MKKYFLYYFLFAVTFCSVFAYGQSSVQEVKVYYRHISLNHMSPYFDYQGRYRISAQLAERVNHYCFTYKKKKLISIEETGTHYSWMIHPLLLIGAKKIEYSYSPGKRIARYYDENGNPTPNYKGVYVEETFYNEKGEKVGLKYFDYKGNPMQGIWNISEYQWVYRDSLVIEYRKNLKGESVDVSPYFPFRISGFRIDSVKHMVTHYNLDKDLHIVDNSEGIAYYSDKENSRKDQLYWKYYNANGTAVHPYGYDKGENFYDKRGSIRRINFYVNNILVGYSSFAYDKKGSVNSYKSVWKGSEQNVLSGTDIVSFKVSDQTKPASIDTVSHVIKVYIKKEMDLSYIVPKINISRGAVIHPASDIPVDFSKGPVSYEVIASNTTCHQIWTIKVEN